MRTADSSRNKYMNLHDFVHNEMLMSQHQLDFLPPRCNQILDLGKRFSQRRDMARNRGLFNRFSRPRWNTDPKPSPPQKYESLRSAEAKLSALDEGLAMPYMNQGYFNSVTPTVPNVLLYSPKELRERSENTREMIRQSFSSRRNPEVSKFPKPSSSVRTHLPLKSGSTYHDLIRSLESYDDSNDETHAQEEFWEGNEKFWKDHHNNNDMEHQRRRNPSLSSQSRVITIASPVPTPDIKTNTAGNEETHENQNETEYINEIPESSGGYGPCGDGYDYQTTSVKPKSYSDPKSHETSGRCPLPRGPCHLQSLTPRCRDQQLPQEDHIPTKRQPLLRFPTRTQNYCGCMGCRPDFYCTKPRSS